MQNLNLETLAGAYTAAKNVTRMLNADHLAQQLRVIADDPQKLIALRLELDKLETHVRVLGLTDIYAVEPR